MAKRRTKGEGSIGSRKRPDGRFKGYVLDPDGERIYFYAKSRAELAEKKASKEAELRNGTYVPPDTTTVAQYLRYWLAEVAALKHRTGTYESHVANVEKHLIPSLGAIKLQQLKAEQIQSRLINPLRDKGRAYNTVRNIRATLRAALNQAVKWGRLPRNVVDATVLPRKSQREITVLNVEQARKLLAEVRETRIELFVWLAIMLGMRRGEILGLRWQDVHLDAQPPYLHITGAIRRTKAHGLTRSEPKTNRSRRKLALIPPVVAAFERQRERQAADRKKASALWQETDYVLTSAVGTTFEQSNLTREFDAALKCAELPDVNFHSLRHTHASILIEANTNPRVVMEVLGHSEIGVTMNLYAHVFPVTTHAAALTAGERLQLIDSSLPTIHWERFMPDGTLVDSGDVTSEAELAQLIRFTPHAWLVRRHLQADGAEAFEDIVVGV